MKHALAWFAFIGFVVSLIFHYLTYFGFTIPLFLFFGLHLGAIGIFFIDGKEMSREMKKGGYKALLDHAPDWTRLAVQLFGAYAIFNFFLALIFLVTSGYEHHQMLSGEYAVYDTGQYISVHQNEEYNLERNIEIINDVPVRRTYTGDLTVFVQISEEEYTPSHRIPEVLRAFSGHWMIFYLVPAIYYGYKRKRKRVEQ